MKKNICFVLGLLVGVAGYAQDLAQLTFSFSTPGPDCYEDGTPVAIGETYVLVFVKNGLAFAGLRTDGTLVDPVNNLIVTQSQAVEGSRCKFKAIQHSSAQYTDGFWVLVLLDTRDPSGAVGGLVAALGESESQAAGSANSLNALHGKPRGGTAGAGLKVEKEATAVAGIENKKPVITAVERGSGTAGVRVADFVEGALYEVQSTTDLAGGWQPAAARVQGKAAHAVKGVSGKDELPVSVTVPAEDKVRFFRVIVPGSN